MPFTLHCHKLHLLSHVPNHSILEREDGVYSLKCGTGIILSPMSGSSSTPSRVSLRYRRRGPLPQGLLKLISLLIPRFKYTAVKLIQYHLFVTVT